MTNYVTADPSRPLIVDISRYQNDPETPEYPDFKKMKSRGVSGVILKGGQATWEDRDFQTYWKLAKAAGLPVGIYWYYDNEVRPEAQADRFLQLPLESAELGVWLDLEDRRDKQYKGWKNWYNFLHRIQTNLPRIKIGIYTAYYYWIEYTKQSNIPKTSLDWFRQFPLWVANYEVDTPLIPDPWKSTWVMWQFTDLLDGKSYGVESFELDGNYFNGSLEDYYEYFGITESTDDTTSDEEEPPTMTERTPLYNCVARFDAKVRATPDTANISNTKLLAGTSFQISAIVPDRLDPTNPAKKWGWIIGGQHDGKYTALEYPNNSNPISTYELISGEVPPPPPPPIGDSINPIEVTVSITPDGKVLVRISPQGLVIDSIWVDSDEYIRKN